MKISTFNVNSINARLPDLLWWLQQEKPDIVLLQELKTEFNSFPFFEIASAGYDAKVLGQKSYNGVAVLSPHKMTVTAEGIPGFEDENSRYLEVLVDNGRCTVRAASVYLPNGNPPYNNPDDTSKFDYKLNFMDALYRHAVRLLGKEEKIVFGGDFNVIYTSEDVYDTKPFENNALFRKEVRQRLAALQYLGWYDAFRMLYPKQNGYTFWDYAGRAFEEDLGMRIDYLFLSPALADCLCACGVDKSLRSRPRPSDHTVLSAEFQTGESEC